MSRLIPNYPPLSNKDCCSSDICRCGKEQIEFGDIFGSDALYKLEKGDDLCAAYDKINANFKMLADGFLLLAHALTHKDKVAFGQPLPVSFQGALFYDTGQQKLYVWNESVGCYIPAYGKNSIDENVEKIGEQYTPENDIPTLQNLRNICDGVDVNYFKNCYGAQEIVFVNSVPTCSVGLFIYDKSKCNMMVWSPEDKKYVPVYGCHSTIDPYACKPTTTGPVVDKIEI